LLSLVGMDVIPVQHFLFMYARIARAPQATE
jgi:hypothetical protein